MSRRAITSDPLELLRGAGDYAIPAGAEERVASSLRASLARPEFVGDSGGGLPLSAEPSGLPRLARRFATWSLPSLCVGVLLGASGSRVFVPASPPAPVSTVATALVSAGPPLLVASSRGDDDVASVPSGRPLASAGASSVAAKSDALAQERAILDRARSRLSASELEAAMKLLDQHAQRFSRGKLSEEREAMAVNVLVRLGRFAEGRRRGEAFRKHFPSSLMLPSVNAALAAESSD